MQETVYYYYYYYWKIIDIFQRGQMQANLTQKALDSTNQGTGNQYKTLLHTCLNGNYKQEK